MKKNFGVVIALLLAVFLSLSVAGQAFAQDQPAAEKTAKKKAAKADRIHGVVQSVNKETSTISVKQTKTGMVRQIVYSDATKWTKVNKPGASLDEVKEGTDIICLGKFDPKGKLEASRVDIRLPK
jgi:cytochrome c-type biogenesis protein CcmE